MDGTGKWVGSRELFNLINTCLTVLVSTASLRAVGEAANLLRSKCGSRRPNNSSFFLPLIGFEILKFSFSP